MVEYQPLAESVSCALLPPVDRCMWLIGQSTNAGTGCRSGGRAVTVTMWGH